MSVGPTPRRPSLAPSARISIFGRLASSASIRFSPPLVVSPRIPALSTTHGEPASRSRFCSSAGKASPGVGETERLSPRTTILPGDVLILDRSAAGDEQPIEAEATDTTRSARYSARLNSSMEQRDRRAASPAFYFADPNTNPIERCSGL